MDDHINLPHQVIWGLIKNEIRFNQSLLMWEILNLVMHVWNAIWFSRMISIFGASCDLEDTITKMWGVPTAFLYCSFLICSDIMYSLPILIAWDLSRQTLNYIIKYRSFFTFETYFLYVLFFLPLSPLSSLPLFVICIWYMFSCMCIYMEVSILLYHSSPHFFETVFLAEQDTTCLKTTIGREPLGTPPNPTILLPLHLIALGLQALVTASRFLHAC